MSYRETISVKSKKSTQGIRKHRESGNTGNQETQGDQETQGIRKTGV